MFSFELCNAFIIIHDRLGFEKFTTVEAKKMVLTRMLRLQHIFKGTIDLTQNGTKEISNFLAQFMSLHNAH